MKAWWRKRQQRRQGHAKEHAKQFVSKPRWIPIQKALPQLQVVQMPQPRVGIWANILNQFNEFEADRANDNNESAFTSGHSFIQKLKKKGFTKLGNGAHSVVLAKGTSDRVIKVGHSGDAWMNYILWGRKMGYEGTLVPKVYSYKWFKLPKDHHHGFYVAVVERMKRCANHHSQDDADPVLVHLMHNAVQGNPHAIKAMDTIHPRAGQFALDLKQAANDNGWEFDIHHGNFMVREDGSFVATDPVNDHCDPCKTRIRAA